MLLDEVINNNVLVEANGSKLWILAIVSLALLISIFFIYKKVKSKK